MHRALTLPEILAEVFSLIPSAASLSCALVCKAWYESALDSLYAKLDGLRCLRKLVGPMESQTEEARCRRRLRWEAFAPYSCRVRRLVLRDGMDVKSLARVRSAQPPIPLFPNATHIQLAGFALVAERALHSVLFLHRGIRSISFPDEQDYAVFFDHIVSHSPNVKEIAVRASSFAPAIYEDSWCHLVQRLPALTRFSAPTSYFKPEFVESLARCPNMQILQIQTWPMRGRDAVERFLDAVAQACPSLTKLVFIVPNAAPAFPEPVTFSALRPLFACSRLFAVTLKFPFAFVMTDQDARELGAHLPLLRRCHLNARFSDFASSYPGMTLNALSAFAESCPLLEELSATVRGAAPPQPIHGVRFRHLCDLGLRFTVQGTGGDARRIAHFLAEITPPFCAFKWYMSTFANAREDLREAGQIDAIAREMAMSVPLRGQLKVYR